MYFRQIGVADHVSRLDRTDGDIDTLAARIAHIRTWTYISYRSEWLSDARHWQERSRAVEDGLSDALHDRLTQRFVDERTSALLRRMNEKQPVYGHVGDDDAVVVEGYALGHIEGAPLRSRPHRASGRESWPARCGIARCFSGDPVTGQRAGLGWRQGNHADIGPDSQLERIPARTPDAGQGCPPSPVSRCFRRNSTGNGPDTSGNGLSAGLVDYIGRTLRPLTRLTETEVDAAGRGILFQMRESMGLLPRPAVENQLNRLTRVERAAMRQQGVRFGANSIFLPAMLRPERSALAAQLWQLHRNPTVTPPSTPAPRQSVSAQKGVPSGFYGATGYVRLGRRAIRADAAERLTGAVHKQTRKSVVRESEDLTALAGCSGEEFARVMRDLGYRRKPEQPGTFIRSYRRPAKAEAVTKRTTKGSASSDSPFAALGELAVAAERRRK